MRSWMIVVIVVAACSKDKPSGPAVKPGEPAGDVLEVTGAVTAHRGDEPMRALNVGDVVSGDDVIGTAADASVVIMLRHNGVRWSLRGGHDKRLADSEAWKAPARGDTADGVGERTTAAGRHAEREAAGTTTSTTAPAKAEAMRQTTAIAPGEPTPGAPPPIGGTPAPLEVGFAVEGEVMPSELDAAMASHRDALLLCVTGVGTRSLTFTVSAAGKVGDVQLGGGALTVDEMCARDVFVGLALPAYANPTTVTVSLSVGE